MSSQGYGGVAARQQWPASRHPDDPSELQAADVAGVAPNFGYHSGPVIRSPAVHVSFWGPNWAADQAHLDRRAHLFQFAQDLLASNYMNILSQYGVGQGAGHAGTVLGNSALTTVTGQLTDGGIHTSIQALINAGTLPEPAGASEVALLIFLDESIEINDGSIVMCEPSGDTAFGYHFHFTTNAGHPFYYGVIPALDDACLRNSCSSDASCSLHLAQTQEQRQTQVASHEISEMVTDPEINAWRDATTGAENGDICNGNSGTITVSGRTWTV